MSEAPKEPTAAKKFASYDPKYKTDQQKKEEVSLPLIINEFTISNNITVYHYCLRRGLKSKQT